MTTPAFDPQPCLDGGAGTAGQDVELTNILCDLDASGNLLGTALAVYEYDPTGTPVGAPTFVDPATGTPYVVQGTLQVCPDGACLPPMQFCQTGTTTGPVEHPGRTYDLTLPINQGFAVDTMNVDATAHAAGITWSIFDVDGDDFAADLKSFIEGRVSGSTVTVTNPNSGVTELCGAAAPMQVHIECLRLDQSPPALIELVYNGGEDLVQNAAYNEVPPFDIHQPCGFHLPKRQDEGGTLACTSVANRGWETNDSADTFEIWCDDVRTGQSTTPTPRGTPVQEISSFGSGNANRATIWQTFQVTTPGTFNIRVVHGARDTGEEHIITLSTGDTDDNAPGDIITNVTTPPSVTSAGGPNPWTTFTQNQPLGAGTYTIALSTTNPVNSARGGLFTDMRVFIDRPNQRATATTDDETCIVTTDETTTTTTCSFWQPQCVGGTVAGWQNAETGLSLTNAQFWAQTPTPKCCTTEAADGGGGSSNALSNLAVSDIVCTTVGGIQQNAVRQVVLDPSGGQLSQQFLSVDGASIVPETWTPGPCTTQRQLADEVLCDTATDGNGITSTVSFLRKYVQTWSATAGAQITEVRDFNIAGTARYTVVGTVSSCSLAVSDVDRESACWTQTSTGSTVHIGTIRHDDNLPSPGWILFDQNQVPVLPTEPGLTFVNCDNATDPIATTGLCLSDGTPIAVVTRRDHETGAVVQDGWINLTTGAFSVGVPPVGTTSCSSSQSIQTSGVFCSVDDATQDVLELIVIEYHYAPDGSIDSVRLVNATTGATYVPPAGSSITVCPTGGEQSADRDIIVLCDDNGGVITPFIRDFQRNNLGQITGHTDYTLANAAYTPTGTVGFCTPNTRDSETIELCDVNAGVPTPFLRTFVRDTNGVITATVNQTLAGAAYVPTGTVAACEGADAESQILCDSAATPVRFLRTYRYSASGAVLGFTDTTLAGAAFTPTGAVGVCAQTIQSDTDFVEEVLCDANGTAFIRLFRFNSTTGVLISTTNTTLAGAAFTPVGTVGLCSDCCPQVIGEGCSNTGSGFYTAIRATNGTITLIDSVSGATITAGNIIACPSDSTVRTLSAEARTVTNGTPWTPGGDVVGTLTSVTATGTAGLWDMVDASGTALTGLPAGLTLTWNVEDDNILTGPVSITPQAGSTVIVSWTRR